MSMNHMPSEVAAVVAVINPASLAASPNASTTVDMENFESVMAIVSIGTIGTSGTVDAKLQQCTAADGTGAKDLGSAATQLTKAGNDDNKQIVLQCRREDLDYKNGFNFVRVLVTPGTAASPGGAVLLGFGPRYGWARANDVATVDEIKTI